MSYEKVKTLLIITFLIKYSQELFPYMEKYSIKESYLPNEWSSIKGTTFKG